MQPTTRLRIVRQQITTRVDNDYVRETKETLQQLWVDEDKNTREWEDVPVVEMRDRK